MKIQGKIPYAGGVVEWSVELVATPMGDQHLGVYRIGEIVVQREDFREIVHAAKVSK